MVCLFVFSDVLYMHRTCSNELRDFKIMMIDGVCRSERMGNGYLCMCGKHLCNSAERGRIGFTSTTLTATLSLIFIYFREHGFV